MPRHRGAGAGRKGDGGRGDRGEKWAAAGRTSGGRGAAAGRTARQTSGIGGQQVEGRQAVRELLAARRRSTREIWLAEGLDPAGVLADIQELAAAARVPLKIVSRARLDQVARTDASQGVVAFAAPLPEVQLDELVRQPAGSAPFLVVLDGVTDPHNLGAVLRTAECAGATGAVLPRHRSAHVTPTVAKAAAGAIEHLPIAIVPGIPAALASLSAARVWTVGLDAEATSSLWDLAVATDPVAIVLGAEGTGLSRLVRDRCEVVVAIPQRRTIGTLNVAAAGALACFEVARRRR